MKKNLFFTLLVMALAGCNNNENAVIENGAELTISTTWADAVATRGIISQFEVNDEIGLYVTSGSLDNLYNNKTEYSNVRSTWGGVTWAQSTNVYLDNKEATVFAYYPHTSAAGNGKAIAVETASQTDYLYGASTSTATVAKPNTTIAMHHALTQVAFKMSTKNYSGNGLLQEVKISNTGAGNTIFTKGIMNCQTGSVTGTETGTLTLNANHTISPDETVFSALCMPVPTPTTSKTILLTFKIDNVDYTYQLSTGTSWLAGTRNLYTIVLEGKDVVIGGGDGSGEGQDGVTIQGWTEKENGEIKLTPVV